MVGGHDLRWEEDAVGCEYFCGGNFKIVQNVSIGSSIQDDHSSITCNERHFDSFHRVHALKSEGLYAKPLIGPRLFRLPCD